MKARQKGAKKEAFDEGDYLKWLMIRRLQENLLWKKIAALTLKLI